MTPPDFESIMELHSWVWWASLTIISCALLAPLVACALFGKEAVCGSEPTFLSIREWISAMGGMLAVFAAVIAVWPVLEQLEESRTLTYLTAVSSLEQEYLGAMKALRDEHELVAASQKDVNQLVSAGGESANDSRPRKGSGDMFEFAFKLVPSLERAANELDSKSDASNGVMIARKALARSLHALAAEIKSAEGKTEGKKESVPFMTERISAIKTRADAVLEDAAEHERQWLAKDQEIAKMRDDLTRTRSQLVEKYANHANGKPR